MPSPTSSNGKTVTSEQALRSNFTDDFERMMESSREASFATSSSRRASAADVLLPARRTESVPLLIKTLSESNLKAMLLTSSRRNLDATPLITQTEAGNRSATSSTSTSLGSDTSEKSEVGTESTYRYDSEPFETFKLKVVQVCKDIGLGEPIEIEHMKGGSFNRVVSLSFASHPGRHCVMRVPRDDDEFEIEEDIRTQVSLQAYISQYLPTAPILAFDSTYDNALARPFVIYDKLPGHTIGSEYYNLPLADKLEITSVVAEAMLKLNALKMPKPGRLVASGSIPATLYEPCDLSVLPDVTSFRMRKHVEADDMPDFEKQPLLQLLLSMLDLQLEEDDWMAEKYERLKQIAKEMQEAGLIYMNDDECALWHWDLAGRNVMIHRTDAQHQQEAIPAISSEQAEQETSKQGKWYVSGILDWDLAKSAPVIMCDTPAQWLWCDEDTRSSKFIGNFDKIPARALTKDELLIKAHFDKIMQQADPNYMLNAYIRGPLLRQIWQLALYGIFAESADYRAYNQLLSDWQAFQNQARPETAAVQVREEECALV